MRREIYIPMTADSELEASKILTKRGNDKTKIVAICTYF